MAGMRIAVMDYKKCRMKDCGKPCISFCPRVRTGDETVVEKDGKIVINEEMCIGCGICTKKCPYGAITIINLPSEPGSAVHQYGKNSFRLYGLPVPVKGKVTGLLGANGIGKTTALNILSGKLRMNLGNYAGNPSDEEIMKRFKGTELQNYLADLAQGKIRAVYKPQQVDLIPRLQKGRVRDILKDERGVMKDLCASLGIEKLLDHDLSSLSGGELQRVAIAAVMMKEADVYYIDEPSSFLDVKQRLIVAGAIRELAEKHGKAVIVVEHDLATLDFLADNIHLVYGYPGAYGVISGILVSRRGINAYLDGYISQDNVRFRDEALKFSEQKAKFAGKTRLMDYPAMEKKYEKATSKADKEEKASGKADKNEEKEEKSRSHGFTLKIEPGFIYGGEILGVFGANALGKTTFARMLAGVEKPDAGKIEKGLRVSYKPQYLTSEFIGTVGELLKSVAGKEFGTTEYRMDIIRPLELDRLIDSMVNNLSGGELQRVAIAVALSRESDFILLDEPSAYLDVEQRVKFAKMIRRFVESRGRTCMIIDHDLLLLDYVSDRAMLFLGESGMKGLGREPKELRDEMNAFLKDLDITFRREPDTGRPRANKPGSQKDCEQKSSGKYYGE